MIATAAPDLQHRHVRAGLPSQLQDHDLLLPYQMPDRQLVSWLFLVGLIQDRHRIACSVSASAVLSLGHLPAVLNESFASALGQVGDFTDATSAGPKYGDVL